MSGTEPLRLGWLHLSRPRENWHRLRESERDELYAEFARIRRETADDGADVFGPYITLGFESWSRFVYFEFSDLSALFRLEERLRAIDYMNYVDFENRLGRVYFSPDERGGQPYCVVALAAHDDAWYSRSREERQRIEDDEIVPPLASLFESGGSTLADNTCDVTSGPEQYFLWEAPSLEFINTTRNQWDGFWRHHRGARMIVGRKAER